MPEFFPFIQGTETNRQHASDASPLLGRFRAVPPAPRSQAQTQTQQQQHLGLLSVGGGRGSVHVGYGALLAAAGLASSDYGSDSDSDDDSDDDGIDYGNNNNGNNRGCATRIWRSLRRVARNSRRTVRDLFITPRQKAVKRVVEKWWSRWGVLVILPAALVSTYHYGRPIARFT